MVRKLSIPRKLHVKPVRILVARSVTSPLLNPPVPCARRLTPSPIVITGDSSRMLPDAAVDAASQWLPLVLTVLERAKSKPFRSGLLWMTLVYSMSVLTGLGQGFLYVGIIGLAYALMLRRGEGCAPMQTGRCAPSNLASSSLRRSARD